MSKKTRKEVWEAMGGRSNLNLPRKPVAKKTDRAVAKRGRKT